MEGLKNIMEDTVEHQLDELLPTMPQICSCKDCRLDMATYALNRLQPNYIRSDIGALYYKVNSSSLQVQTEILATVMNAITTIGAHPHHKKEQNT